MSRELDNANPTIFAPSSSTLPTRQRSPKALLWDEEADDYVLSANPRGEAGDSDEEREEIDSMEVYGEWDRGDTVSSGRLVARRGRRRI
jgi:hypothetical protein